MLEKNKLEEDPTKNSLGVDEFGTEKYALKLFYMQKFARILIDGSTVSQKKNKILLFELVFI